MKLSEYCPEIAQVLSPVIGEGEGLTCMTLLHLHAIGARGAMQSQYFQSNDWDFYKCIEELYLHDRLDEHCPAFADFHLKEWGPEKERLQKTGFTTTQWLKFAEWARGKLGQHKLFA